MFSEVVKVARSQLQGPKLLLNLPRLIEVEVTDVQKFTGRIIIKLRTINRNSEMILDLDHDQIIWKNGVYFDLTGEEHIGTDSFGTLILGLPAIMVTAPVLAVNTLFWKTSNKVFGMSRHAISIWCRLRHQLDRETQNHLLGMLSCL